MSRFAKATLLLFFFSLCAAAFFITASVRKRVPAPTAHELFVVVNDQLAAFRADDFSSAYRQASTSVQQKFTLSQFEAMVRRNYLEMAHAQRVEFGSVRVADSTAVMEVFFFASDGSARVFVYSLISEDGGWKIGGVEELSRSQPDRLWTGTHV